MYRAIVWRILLSAGGLILLGLLFVLLSSCPAQGAETIYQVAWIAGDVGHRCELRVWPQPKCAPYRGCYAGWSDAVGQLHGRRVGRTIILSPTYRPGDPVLQFVFGSRGGAGWVVQIDPRPLEGLPAIGIFTYWHPATYRRM